MEFSINQELNSINLDILVLAGISKTAINRLHKLKARKIGDLEAIDKEQLAEALAGEEATEAVAEMLSKDLMTFTKLLFTRLNSDPAYEMVRLHAKNHTHVEIAQRFSLSKEKVKQNISKFFQLLFTLVDALGNKMIANKPYIAIEELEAVVAEDDCKLLLLAFKAHDTKWAFHNTAEVFIIK